MKGQGRGVGGRRRKVIAAGLVWLGWAGIGAVAGPGVAGAAERINTAYISVTPSASAALWVAKDAGLFERNGLQANVIFIFGTTRGIQALLAGETPLVESGGPAVIHARLGGADVVMVAGTVGVLPYYLVTTPDIRTPADLKGKVGANHIPGTTAEFALRFGLRGLGLDPASDVTLQVIGGSMDRMIALQRGMAKFTVTTEPGKVLAEKLGFRILVDFASLKIPFQQTGIATTRRFAESRPDTVRRYIRAVAQAIHVYKTQKERAIQIMRKYSRMENLAVLEGSYEWHQKFFQESPLPSVEAFRRTLQEIGRTQPAALRADPQEFVDLRFARELEESGFIRQLYGR